MKHPYPKQGEPNNYCDAVYGNMKAYFWDEFKLVIGGLAMPRSHQLLERWDRLKPCIYFIRFETYVDMASHYDHGD